MTSVIQTEELGKRSHKTWALAGCTLSIPAGHVVGLVSGTLGSHRGAAVGPGTTVVNNCVASHGIRVAESYQPASHYWPLQWSENGMFLALALALAGYCFWRLNRRRT